MNRPDTISSPADTSRLIRCNRCGRHGWHDTDRCDETDPTWLLDEAVNRLDALRLDLDAVLRTLPDDAPLWSVVDLADVNDQLRTARAVLDRCADNIGADR